MIKCLNEAWLNFVLSKQKINFYTSQFAFGSRAIMKMIKMAKEEQDRPFCQCLQPMDSIFGNCHSFGIKVALPEGIRSACKSSFFFPPEFVEKTSSSFAERISVSIMQMYSPFYILQASCKVVPVPCVYVLSRTRMVGPIPECVRVH